MYPDGNTGTPPAAPNRLGNDVALPVRSCHAMVVFVPLLVMPLMIVAPEFPHTAMGAATCEEMAK